MAPLAVWVGSLEPLDTASSPSTTLPVTVMPVPPGGRLFFPSDGVGVDVARRICADCPVKSECLEYALANRIDHGVWGGTSERERRRIIKARARERVTSPS